MTENVPDGVSVLPNGAWQDKKSGRIVKAAPGQPWDSKKAAEMARLRHQKLKEKTAEGIVEAVREKGGKAIEDFPEAHKEVAKTLMAEIVLNDQARGGDRMKTYESLVYMEGSMGNPRKPDQEQGGMVISFSPEIASKLIDRVMSWKSRQTGEVVEAQVRVVDDGPSGS